MSQKGYYYEPARIEGILDKATNAVNKATSFAAEMVERDKNRVFVYKRPKIGKMSTTMSLSYDESGFEPRPVFGRKDVQWSSIADFDIETTLDKIENYVSLWVLSPNTQFDLVKRDHYHFVQDLGSRHYVDALFTKPVPRCPNPLAIAKVFFQINVSKLMPDDYAIMVTYQFEGYRTLYYALGDRCNQSFEFQKYFIDLIIDSKLKSYKKFLDIDLSVAQQKEELEEKQDDELSGELVDTGGPCKRKQ